MLSLEEDDLLDLFPGDIREDVAVLAENAGEDDVTVEDFEVVDWTTDLEDCDADENFLVEKGDSEATPVAAGDEEQIGHVSVEMIETGTNQDACQDATLTIELTTGEGDDEDSGDDEL